MNLLIAFLIGCSHRSSPNSTPEEFCDAASATDVAGADDLAVLCAEHGDCYESPPALKYISPEGLDFACGECAVGWKCDLTVGYLYPCDEAGEPDGHGTRVDFVVPVCRGYSTL